jgi:glycosyltransferase involved in cell wall biosynthesis
MRIGIVKPDFHIVGGAEGVLKRVAGELRQAGHSVSSIPVDVAAVSPHPYGVHIPEEMRARARNFFRYMALVEEFSSLEFAGFDVVISTQPPSFAAHHPRHLSLFFHHERMYYDLAQVYCDAGYAPPALHADVVERVRRVDAARLAEVRHFLANSEEVQRRLGDYNGLTANVGVLIAGVDPVDGSEALEPAPAGHVLCVSRHEFPKRTELFVHAMKLAGDARGVVAGGGGRLEYVRRLDAWLSSDTLEAAQIESRSLWLSTGDVATLPVPRVRRESNVAILGSVDDEHLTELYRGALCLVAPAFLEDFGLTALEAMAHGKPVIVCDDGGHLAQLVQDGVTGLVVPPTAQGIGAAVQRLRSDAGLLRKLGCQARERASEFTWERFRQQLWTGLDAVMS